MNQMQIRLANFPIDKEEAEKIAHELIRDKYGNIPSIGDIKIENDNWIILIEAKYPRVLYDIQTNRPKRVRYMNFKNIGLIKIDAHRGIIVEKPKFYDLRNEIISKLNFVRKNVEKALVKVGANKFSQLPFSEHMHTPIQDIISQLLINEKLDLKESLSFVNEEDKGKYLKNIELLEKMGLVRRNELLIIPDNVLIEIESRNKNIAEKLSDVFSYFFAKGYENIDTIGQVLGPYLYISGYIYEQGVEYDEPVSVSYSAISDILDRSYSNSALKQIKLPRYLIQLAGVGLIDQEIVNGETFWKANLRVFDNLIKEGELINPIKSFFVEG